MEHTTFNPGSSLNFLVVNYLFLRTRNFEEQITEKFIPNGFSALVFNFSGTVFVTDRTKRWTLPHCFLVKPLSRSITIHVGSAPDTMVVLLKTSVFTRFFNTAIDYESGLPYQSLESLLTPALFQDLKKMDCCDARIQFFENFILEKIADPYQSDEIDKLYLRIMTEKGTTPIKQLLEESNFSPRSFRRKFLPRVGLCAKTLSRVVRINELWTMYLSGQEIDFQNMIFDGRYFDQSHLIRDFKKLVGETPTRFFKRDQEKVKFVSGKY